MSLEDKINARLKQGKSSKVSLEDKINTRIGVNPDSAARMQEAAGGQRQPDADPYEIERARLMQAFNEMPWYKQAGTAADDLARLAASGASFGGLDRVLGEEDQRFTEEARIRAGFPGTVAEIGGMIASPVTRAVGAGANALRPASKGLWQALASLGITGGEGAILAGTEAAVSGKNDIGEQALLGGGLASGAEATLKHAVPKPLGIVSSLLSKVPYKALSDTFNVASDSALGSRAISDIRSNRAPSKLIDKIEKDRLKFEGVPAKDIGQVEEALLDVFNRTTTSSGNKALDAADQKIVNNLINQAYDTKVDATKFNRPNLDDLISYLENTRIPVAAEKSVAGMHVKNVHDAVKKVGAETDPAFNDLMDLLKTKSTAYTAGHATKEWLPKTSVFDKAKDAAIVGSLLAGSGAISPMLMAALAPITVMASPRAVGRIAQTSGTAKRIGKKVVPKGTGYGVLGLAPAVKERNERKGAR